MCPDITNLSNGGSCFCEKMSSTELSWSISSPSNITDGSKELGIVIKRLSMGETSSELEGGRSENEMTVRSSPNTICNGSESSTETKFSFYKTSDMLSECDSGVQNEGSDENSACFEENTENNEKSGFKRDREHRKRRHSKKRKRFSRKHERNSEEWERCQSLSKINWENDSCGTSSEYNLTTVGGDGENRKERSRWRKHELKSSSNEINMPNVIASCDLTSNPVIKIKSDCSDVDDQKKSGRRDCPRRTRLASCSTSQSPCSEGSYSRRKHHKHHKRKERNRSVSRSEDPATVSPKVNPVFLWVQQEDTRIVEVFCEDYDYRNRIRLTKTHLGWRAIPKTERFAQVMIPKPIQKEDGKEVVSHVKPKRKKLKKRKTKEKKSRRKVHKSDLSDNLNQTEDFSTCLSQGDSTAYCETEDAVNGGSTEDRTSDAQSRSDPDHAEPCSDSERNLSRSSSQELIDSLNETSGASKRLNKSKSCDFPSVTKVLESLPRSISMDLNLKGDNNDFDLTPSTVETEKPKLDSETKSVVDDIVKSEVETDDDDVEIIEELTEKTDSEPASTKETENAINQRENHSESLVMDLTGDDSDFNDTDCDDLGQLLKDIPDLDFVDEGDLEEVDEDEEWSTPTDLTLPKSDLSLSKTTIDPVLPKSLSSLAIQPKSPTETKIPNAKLSILPPNISPLVTVTSSAKPLEPLTAPLPEVTITPIPNPKPVQVPKTQNKLLRSLLFSSPSVKPESDEINLSADKCQDSVVTERKSLKHSYDSESHFEIKAKKLKVEPITLKNLLSKNQFEKPVKSSDVKGCEQALKSKETEDCSKSRLQELLIERGSSDPISQLKEVLSNPNFAVPDPLLVPRARLPALVASPASEIPRLLTMRPDKAVEKMPHVPFTDSDVLEVSLSNLQSLLSVTPEKLNSTNEKDLADYQKSLETFLEWQRYQTEMMKAQMKNSKSMPPGLTGDVPDVASAAAFGQMLWLPYVNQMDFNGNTNRDVVSFMNSLATDYQTNSSNLSAPPQININQVPQPSPFLTPTSPMDIESHLKTLAMWQEAVGMQQNSQAPRPCSKIPTAGQGQQDMRRGVKVPNNYPAALKKQSAGPNVQSHKGSIASPISSAGEPLQNSHLGFEIYQDISTIQNNYHKKQINRQNSFQHRLEEHQIPMEQQQQQQQQHHQKYKQLEQHNQFRKFKQTYSNYQSELLRQYKTYERKKPGPQPGSISVKPLSNLMQRSHYPGESKNSWKGLETEEAGTGGAIKSSTQELRNQMALKLQQFNTQIEVAQRKEDKPHSDKPKVTEVRGSSTEKPKLKVKNLVDPNMSPPKLLKRIAPEHLPIVMNEHRSPPQDDSQAHLWHPLFGSNQIKTQPYNSPWNWTTVTVNGE